MVWLLVALILGSVGFAASTIMKYKAFLDEVQPRLNRARTAADRLEKGAEVETTRKHQDEEQREELKKRISGHKTHVAEVKKKIMDAEKEQEELEMKLAKQDFKKAR
jgi:septal ring factor EnvC (AmiA/AmiB activator)